MKVAMVKHSPNSKTYWFEVPEYLADKITPNTRVACDTVRGLEIGVAVGSVLNMDEVRAVMLASGAKLPLKKIVAIPQEIPLDEIKIPKYMSRTTPRDEKIAKRFLEYYHTGKFNTHVALNSDGMLRDGYSAYLVAKKIGLPSITAFGGKMRELADDFPF